MPPRENIELTILNHIDRASGGRDGGGNLLNPLGWIPLTLADVVGLLEPLDPRSQRAQLDLPAERHVPEAWRLQAHDVLVEMEAQGRLVIDIAPRHLTDLRTEAEIRLRVTDADARREFIRTILSARMDGLKFRITPSGRERLDALRQQSGRP